MSKCNLIEYSDNYSDTSGSLWQFKRDESPVTNAGNPDNVSTTNSTTFKYKSSFFKSLEDDDNGVFKDMKIAVPLTYLSNFWRSLEMPLINWKIHLELNWSKDCVMSTIGDRKCKNNKHQIIRSNCYFIMQRQPKIGKTIRRRIYWNLRPVY